MKSVYIGEMKDFHYSLEQRYEDDMDRIEIVDDTCNPTIASYTIKVDGIIVGQSVYRKSLGINGQPIPGSKVQVSHLIDESALTDGIDYEVEYTDTFGGEANYCWAVRKTIPNFKGTERQLIRKAKALIGLTGVKCDKSDFGEVIELRPVGCCTVMFITATTFVPQF